MNREIFYCAECNFIFQKTEFDRIPKFIFDKNLNDYIAVPHDDLSVFRKKHGEHRIQKMSVLENKSYSRMPYAEIKRVSYFEATDGKNVYLIKKWKDRIDEPMKYKIIRNARLRVENEKVSPRSDLIRKQMAVDIPLMNPKEIDKFVAIVEKIVSKASLEELEECFWDTGNPMITLVKLGRREIRNLLSECQKNFNWIQLKSIREFIEGHNKGNDVMTLSLSKKMTLVKEKSGFDFLSIKSALSHN